MIRKELKREIEKALMALEVGFSGSDTNLEQPADFKFGDYSTNVAMVVAKTAGLNPKDLAEKIAEQIRLNNNPNIKDVQVAGGGFVNFYLSEKFFAESLRAILKTGDNYGRNQTLSGRKVVVEYTDPNPFKEFHIGHLMSNSIGEALSRIIEANGAETKRACYQGDVGLHVAKTIWGYFQAEKKENLDIHDWGKFYVAGSKAYETDEETKKEINDINRQVYGRTNDKTNQVYDLGRQASLEYFAEIYKRLGTSFDFYFFESETEKIGKKMVEVGLSKGIFEKSDGAIVFRGEKFDESMHTRVFVNSLGLSTYEAKDLGLAKLKFERYPYDLSVLVTGNEVLDYFRVMLKALDLLEPELAAKARHVAHGMLRLPTGKMSSRTGEVITAVSLIEEVKKRVLEKTSERELPVEKKEEIAEKVAIGAIKFSILKQSPGRDIVFDFDRSLSLEGDSGPYLQYAYTRAKSVLAKADKEIVDFTQGEEPMVIEKLLIKLPAVVERSFQELAPQHIVTYLVNLASSFNSYYAKNKIIGSENEAYRLVLTRAVAQTLKSGLTLLGIPVLEEM
ncbi:MAG TPA: arginine--tRNA ligase [Candidatus Paceibacterota bacterium]|nr:arginine--tRNA ligase [Candidatus Paceibacterota bacterium]